MAVHAAFLFILSWIYFDLPHREILDSMLSLVVANPQTATEIVEINAPDAAEPTDEPGEIAGWNGAIELPGEAADLASVTFDSDSFQVSDRGRLDKVVAPSPEATAATPPKSGKSAARKGSNTATEAPHTDHFAGRGGKTKADLLKRMGGTAASEAAVARGLVWLKNHQLPDGGWNFNHLHSPECNCTMPGRMENNPNAATAMALLAFLGAGQTHESADYQAEVRRGLDFLLACGVPADRGVCFYGNLSGPPTFYTHGLATIALSEAFAMTGDARLRPAISGAIEFLVATQEAGGGWRYFPGQPGDTSVVAWQLMALKSAQFSRITVPPRVFTGIDRFMASVSSRRGALYAYIPDRREDPTPSMTAAGLLCRMYLDWSDSQGRLSAGIRFLDEQGPAADDMYYNYYATQVLHHWGGPEWERWNKKMREHLITTQIREGHAAGSWDVADRHGQAGGRLYMTTLALLTLEVYYRHLPLYQKDRIEVPLINQAADVKKR
jgi:hypothetical protein